MTLMTSSNIELKDCYLLYNVMMRQYKDGEPTSERGSTIQIRCGLGQNSLSFDEGYQTSVAGKRLK